MQAGNSVNSFPGWGGATTTNPRLARVTVKKSDCSGNPHEPWEKSTIGQCRRSTTASRKTSPLAVPVPGLAGYQMAVASGRGWPVVLEVRVHVMVVAPTANGPGPVTSARASVGASNARAMRQCAIRITTSAPGVSRTPDLQVRSLTLYPAELRAQSTNGAISKGSGGCKRRLRGLDCARTVPRLCPDEGGSPAKD